MCGTCNDQMSGFCPSCSTDSEPEKDTCTYCNGVGLYWFDEDGNETKEETPESVGYDLCPHCRSRVERAYNDFKRLIKN